MAINLLLAEERSRPSCEKIRPTDGPTHYTLIGQGGERGTRQTLLRLLNQAYSNCWGKAKPSLSTAPPLSSAGVHSEANGMGKWKRHSKQPYLFNQGFVQIFSSISLLIESRRPVVRRHIILLSFFIHEFYWMAGNRLFTVSETFVVFTLTSPVCHTQKTIVPW